MSRVEYLRLMEARQHCIADVLFSYTHFMGQSIAIPRDASLRPQMLDLATGRMQYLVPDARIPGAYRWP